MHCDGTGYQFTLVLCCFYARQMHPETQAQLQLLSFGLVLFDVRDDSGLRRGIKRAITMKDGEAGFGLGKMPVDCSTCSLAT